MTPAGVVTTLAGTAGILGSADGTGAAARFNDPAGVAVDSAGYVHVADRNNNVIRKITTSGAVTTLAGKALDFGAVDATGALARFSAPFGVAVDTAATCYVADAENNTIRKITSTGIVTTLAGAAGSIGSMDGEGAAARFTRPTGLAVDSTGVIAVADTFNFTIRRITKDGSVSTLAGSAGSSGSTDGTAMAALFGAPSGVAVDGAGNIYVADTLSSTIRKVTSAGAVTTIAGQAGTSGSLDGSGTGALFNQPEGVAVDGAGNVYVADTLNSTIRKITPAGVVTTLTGSARNTGSADGTSAAARFSSPVGLTVDSNGNIYVADELNSAIRKITPAGVVTTIAGRAGSIGIVLGTMPGFAKPISLAVVGDSLVIVDTNAILLLEHSVK